MKPITYKTALGAANLARKLRTELEFQDATPRLHMSQKLGHVWLVEGITKDGRKGFANQAGDVDPNGVDQLRA